MTAATGDTTHECPHPRCAKRVARHMFACKPHWYALPREYRDQIWRTYRHAPGSEDHTTALGDALRWYRDQLAAEASG